MNEHMQARQASDSLKPENTLSLSAVLKQATTEAHETIEHGSEINRRIVERFTDETREDERNAYRETYRMFLQAAYGFERSVLERIKDLSNDLNLDALGYFPESNDAAELILADLRSLNGDEALSDLPRMSGLPKIESLAELAGMEYVRRGSRNGNAYIARIVKHNLGFDETNGASFLNLDRDLVHPHWLQFKEWLDSLQLTLDAKRSAAEAAIATFRSIGEWHHQFKL